MSSKQNVSRSFSTKESTTSKSDASSFLDSLKTAFRSSSFSTSASEDIETIEPDTQSENQGLLSKYSQKLKTAVNAGAFINKSKNMVQGAQESLQHSLNFTKYLPYIIMLCLAGAFFLFLAFTLLPIILLAPQKFSSCFALGCLCFMGAIALVRGPQKFLLSLVQKEKLIFTITYVCSLIGTFMFSKVWGSHFLALIFAGLQAISLLWLIAASVPGGKKVASTVQSLVIKCCTGCWKKMLGGGSSTNNNKSWLPI